MADSFNKKDREKKRQKRKKDKAERKEQRKLEGKTEIEFMYMDENGNLVSTPPDPTKKKVVKVEDIVLGVPKKEDREFVPPEIPPLHYFCVSKALRALHSHSNAKIQFMSMGHGSTCTPCSKHVSAEISLPIKLIRDI